jgi:hypothetical protein
LYLIKNQPSIFYFLLTCLLTNKCANFRLFFSFRSFVSFAKEKKYTMLNTCIPIFINIFRAKQVQLQVKVLLSPRQLPSSAPALPSSAPADCHSRAKAGATMDFLRVKIASIRMIQAQLVCRATGKLLNVYRLHTSKSLRMVRLTLLTAAIRDAMPASAI